MERPIFRRGDNFAEMRAAFFLERCLLIRGALKSERPSALAEIVSQRYREWDRRALAPNECALFHQGHIPAQEIGAATLEASVNDGYLRDFIRGVFGWALPLRCPPDFLVRRILPPTQSNPAVAKAIPFHQDEHFARINGASDPQLCFTLWIPLVHCGLDAPGLTVIQGSDLPLIERRPREGWALHILRRFGPSSMWSPEMFPGDVLAFTSRAIHGSYVKRRMTRPRYSVEVRGGVNAPVSL